MFQSSTEWPNVSGSGRLETAGISSARKTIGSRCRPYSFSNSGPGQISCQFGRALRKGRASTENLHKIVVTFLGELISGTSSQKDLSTRSFYAHSEWAHKGIFFCGSEETGRWNSQMGGTWFQVRVFRFFVQKSYTLKNEAIVLKNEWHNFWCISIFNTLFLVKKKYIYIYIIRYIWLSLKQKMYFTF